MTFPLFRSLPSRASNRLRGAVATAALAVAALALHGARGRSDLPEIVFVSRAPASAGSIPGLGPAGRTLAPGGRLMIRERDGTVRSLLAPGAMHDCSDPAPSFDGERMAFAGTSHPDSGWRIWVVRRDGSGLAPVTGDARGFTLPPSAGTFDARFDDVDPCWVGAHTLVFASTRVPSRSQYAGAPVTNLWLVRDDGAELRRLTAERNGAEEPALDPSTGAIVYARWWFNRWQASDATPGAATSIVAAGITEDPSLAMPRDSVNLWQLVSIRPGAHGPRLAAGSMRNRRDAMGTEPAIAANGAVLATYARNLGLWPSPGATGVHRMPTGAGEATRIAGAIVPEDGADPYRNTTGLAAPSACAPAWLPDGRALVSLDPGGRGDFGLWIARGDEVEPLLDLPGTLELDAAPLVARRAPDIAWERDPGIAPTAEAALLRGDFDPPPNGTFTFACEDVFAGEGTAGAPARVAGTKLRFFVLRPRFDRTSGDTAVLLREVPVDEKGAVHATDLPAAVPMFEQLVGPTGAPLRSAHGPAHVAGANAGSAGAVTRCVGCHTGHSRLAVAAR